MSETTEGWSQRLQSDFDELRAARDELRVRVHLGQAEMRDRWEDLERKWHHVEGKLKVLRQESAESAEEIGAAARELVVQIRDGYRHLRQLV